VTVAYLVMLVAGFLSLVHPVWMRSFNYISAQSTWIAIAGTGLFYYSILISEVLFASAINLSQARRMGKRGGLYGAPYAVVELSGGGSSSSSGGAATEAAAGHVSVIAPAVVPVASHIAHAHGPEPSAPPLPPAPHAPNPSAESGPIESFY
jgi:hypothetical protein